MLERGRRARPPVPERLLEGDSTLSLMIVNLQGLSAATIFLPNDFCGGGSTEHISRSRGEWEAFCEQALG
jgi:hypothetical protein